LGEIFYRDVALVGLDIVVDFVGCDRVELFDQIGCNGESLVVVGDEIIEVPQGVEAVLEGVGGGFELAGGRAGAGGFGCVSAVGFEGRFGHGFLAWGLHGRGVVGYVLIFGLFIFHWISPEQKLADGEVDLMFEAGLEMYPINSLERK